MASNFDFLSDRYPKLFEHASHAERLVHTAPRASCFYARFTLEQAVHWLYANDAYLQLPYENNLAALIHEQTFKDNLNPPSLFHKVRNIHKTGNIAVHDSTAITDRDSLFIVQELFHFLYWLCRYYAKDGKTLPTLSFDLTLVPQPQTAKQDLSLPQLQELKTLLSQADEMRRIAEERQQQTEQQITSLQAEVAALKQQNETVPDTHDYKEADTRRYLIDVLLKEAGWNIHQPRWTEYEVQGMPNSTGKGYVDYVLWGDDGKPLALVEAKRTTKDPKEGKRQAELYANCLEAQFGQRPLLFYSNGYEHWLWDDQSYPPRNIEGFLKKDELERLIFRRTSRKRLHLVQTNPAIVERSYQTEAIRRITEAFDQKKSRKALLVMATGTGKTRTAIALVDLLIRANWVKRVLFLADRNALLTQTFRAFKTHLPTVTPIDLTKNKDIEGGNAILSTYSTMLNFINRVDGNGRIIGPGYFDLVIVDEAHRSIYKKYSVLFEYFDALLVGLTATPRDEVHRDTYRIFELEKGNPTFAYELEDATKDRHLVPAKGIDVPFKFLRKGIRYVDLPPQEQEEYEERFRDHETGAIPDQVNAAALYRWLFNINTVDQALELLMQRGLKVEGGDRLGKTIIFARTQKHAEFIVERFDANYPHYKGKFAQVIHSDISYAESILDDFSNAAKQPTIAVSVDMLDTGIDVPEVVNLVFFKPVYSQVKFNQMIGRGTRLCLNLFGIDDHKTEFLVFDLCGNFDFFQQAIPEANQKPPETLTSRLIRSRLELTQLLNQQETSDPERTELRSTLLNDLHQHVATMEPENFLVRRHLQQVEEFSKRERWEQLSEEDSEIIASSLSTLPNKLPSEDRLSKEFDLLCLKLQLSILKRTNDFVRLRDQVRDLLHQLETKQEIPMVKEQLPLIEEVQAEDWWTDVTPWMIDYVRIHLRDLIKFIDRQEQRIVYTDFADEMGDVQLVDVPNRQTGFSPYQYRKKVEAYIQANENHVAIAKLKRNVPLTASDLESLETMLFSAAEIESRAQFETVFGKTLSLKLFIRQLVGLDRNAAKQAFAHYLEGTHFSANQIRFIETIIDYLTQNGVMDPGQLYELPFTEAHPDGLDGIFDDDDADQIVTLVRSFNETVEAAFGAAS
ncbi:DEAD/DEAH box helicase family protein [Leptolyngbya sp. FACHB-321]|uniref:DEAD/DEAH box helicase family protein n=1 Tax=Leptolyngbya sp. FACHB-321 TaxID=2692807 RepID=UPI0016894064|nr:DEAD/DEAH box helicase family protein [Leptolyngbya sp. FACHB-321]MBD2034553.1 DEAD/DEAH box helicase family protein [Leptolyngbya sp. FACHB-321]